MSLSRYPLPARRLGRLDVDGSARKKGIGTWLLRYVFTLGLGCTGYLVDAKAGAGRSATTKGSE